MDEKYLIRPESRDVAEETIEITKSFSLKRNLGNYESADFFTSAKKRTVTSDAERTSDLLYQFCKSQVMKDIRAFEETRQVPQSTPRRTG
jgi:hypothetical protein